jgi:hypothetical protein
MGRLGNISGKEAVNAFEKAEDPISRLTSSTNRHIFRRKAAI